MILFSIITMRDLIRNYKMIIKGKNEESDTDNDPLLSSGSPQGYGTSGEPLVFKQESYSTESEDDVPIKSRLMSPFSIQQSKSTITPTNYDDCHEKAVLENHCNIYNGYQPYSCPADVFTETGTLLPVQKEFTNGNLVQKEFMNGSLYESIHGFIEVPPQKSTNNSMVTIFAVWNTTMGSSLLAMAWGLEKSGFFAGIFINIAVAAICLYSAYILLKINEKHGIQGQNLEVPDLCRLLIGKWAEMVAKVFSFVMLIGANVIYWILMSNFLYNFVLFVHDFFIETDEKEEPSVLCNKEIILNGNYTTFLPQTLIYGSKESTFDRVWNLYSTVPIFLAVLLFPFLNFKSPTFFTKFNSLGTISAAYLIIFAATKSFSWGVNMQNWPGHFNIKATFCVLSGMLSMSYFIHNIIITMMRQNKHQKHNGRDLTIAFSLITFTYLFIGVAFYISFPLAKSCIEDNILNNFSKKDILSMIARLVLLFQLFTVFPLMAFMLRNDILINLNIMFKNNGYGDFSYKRAVIINATVVFICIMFACFLPRIGTLIRYTGALSGMVYIFLFPSLLKIASLRKEGALTTTKLILFITLIIIGLMNLISQFLISDS